MQAIPVVISAKLIANFQWNQKRIEADAEPDDFFPVVKLFTPWAGATWLFTEFDPAQGLFFGLCDLGLGEPELGYASLEELQSLRGKADAQVVERDIWFQADKSLSRYAAIAREERRIIT